MKEFFSKKLNSKLYKLIWFLIKRRLYPKFCITLITIGVALVSNFQITERIIVSILNHLEERPEKERQEILDLVNLLDVWVGIGLIVLGVLLFILLSIRYENSVKKEELDNLVSGLISKGIKFDSEFSPDETVFLEQKISQSLQSELMEIIFTEIEYNNKLKKLKLWKLKALKS
jgi:glucan phosphoethanolaminetransferase (alkaline phosphatase superfamily)